MDKDLISVIMPAYNAENYIREAINSVIDQTYTNWELIIVDDGSTDSTSTIINEYVVIDNRIKYQFQKNGKQGKARNLGIKQSIGNYIAFLDADDFWVSNKLEIQLEIIKKHHDIDLIFSQGYKLINDKIEDFSVCVKQQWNINDFEKFLGNNQIPILSVLVKKEVLLSVNSFSEQNEIQNAEDYHLWLKLLLKNFKFISIPDRLFYYRIHETQATFEDKETSGPTFNTLLDIYNYNTTKTEKTTIINNIKWMIFKNEFHQKCIAFFSHHLIQKRLNFLAFLIKNVLGGRNKIQTKIVFHLISKFS